MTSAAMTSALRKLQSWYQAQCDEDWEHGEGITIETLDNPGWSLEIALALLTLALQYYFPQLPAWAPRIVFGAGIFLFGVSVGLIAAGGLR